MTNRKCALLIFSKPPVPGLVKTRLTRERGGILTPEQAAEFFRRSLYDVSELSMHALIELQRENDAAVAADPTAEAVTYDFYVSTTPADNVELMRETYEAIGPWPMEVHYLTMRAPSSTTTSTTPSRSCSPWATMRWCRWEATFPRCRRATSPRPSSGSTTSAPSARPVSCRGAVPGVRHVFGWLVRRNPHGQPGRLLQHRRQSGARRLRREAEGHRRPLGVPVAGGRCGRGERSGPRHLVPARHRGGGPGTRGCSCPGGCSTGSISWG